MVRPNITFIGDFALGQFSGKYFEALAIRVFYLFNGPFGCRFAFIVTRLFGRWFF
jgi:hypothetical protein